MIDIIRIFITETKELFPYITSFILFYLNWSKDKKAYKTDVLQKRVQKLYFPFYQKYSAGMLYHRKLSEASEEVQDLIFDLLTNNLDCMDTKSQRSYFIFYHAFLELHKKKYTNPNSVQIEAHYFDKTFNLLAMELLEEYSHISRKLGMPKPVTIYPNSLRN